MELVVDVQCDGEVEFVVGGVEQWVCVYEVCVVYQYVWCCCFDGCVYCCFVGYVQCCCFVVEVFYQFGFQVCGYDGGVFVQVVFGDGVVDVLFGGGDEGVFVLQFYGCFFVWLLGFIFWCNVLVCCVVLGVVFCGLIVCRLVLFLLL